MKRTSIIFAFILSLLAVTAATALPISDLQVDIDNIDLTENAVNRLSLERGQEYNLRITFTSEEDMNDVEIRAFLSGYEYSDVEDVEDKTPVFDTEAGVTYVKKLSLVFPSDIDSDDYKLRVLITDKYNEEFVANYNLKVDLPRNNLVIEDVIFNPSNSVRAGSALLTKVRVENRGEKTQDDVRVTVSIPDLNVKGTAYIEEIDNGDDEEETEEIFIRIPKCTEAGNYDVKIDVEYSQRHRKTSEVRTITVLEDDTCNEEAAPESTIIINSEAQNVLAGETAVFPIVLKNSGRNSKSFTINVQPSDFATISITPTNLVVVPAGQSQTVFVNAQINEDAPSGAHSISATVQSGKFTQELSLTTTITAKSGAKGVLEAILIALVVILIIVAIVIGVSYLRNKEQTEAYY